MYLKRYINTSLLYAILAMIGGVFYQEFTKFNGFPANRTGRGTYPLLHAGHGLLPAAAFAGKEFFLYRCSRSPRADFLSYWSEPDRCDVFGTGHLPGSGCCAFFRYECSNLRIAGIGHILLGVSLVLLLVQIKRSVVSKH